MSAGSEPFALPDEDRAALKAALESMRAGGDANPRIPLNVDLDGDGVADAWALDESGEVTLVADVPLAETSYEASGETGGVSE